MAEVTPALMSALRRATLMRMCRACSRLERSGVVEVEHVQEALDVRLRTDEI